MLGLFTAPLRQSQAAPESGEVILLDGFEDSDSFGLNNRGLELFLNFYVGCSSGGPLELFRGGELCLGYCGICNSLD